MLEPIFKIKINLLENKNKQKCIALRSFHFSLFVEAWILWNPLWVFLKQTRGNNCPPLPMRLLLPGVLITALS